MNSNIEHRKIDEYLLDEPEPQIVPEPVLLIDDKILVGSPEGNISPRENSHKGE